MSNPSAPDVVTFLDNADLGPHAATCSTPCQPPSGCICTGYVSRQGLQFLADWLDQLDPHGEAQLLMGMPPTGWKYPPSTGAAGATYLRRHLGADAGSLDLEVWAELGADGLPEITGETPRANWQPETEIIEEGEVIVPSRGVPARRGLAAAFEGGLGSMDYRLMGAVLLFVIGVLVAFAGGWWGVGIGLMIMAGVVLPRSRG